MLSHYNGSYTAALFAVYPDIGLQRENFAVMPSNNKFIANLNMANDCCRAILV